MAEKIKLRELAHARAGDKGESNNICLFPYDEKDFELIRKQVTAKVVKRHFKGLVTGAVIRYDIPSLYGINIVSKGVLRYHRGGE